MMNNLYIQEGNMQQIAFNVLHQKILRTQELPEWNALEGCVMIVGLQRAAAQL